MFKVLTIICLLIWLPVLVHQIQRRSFVVLLIWLFIAPIASNLVNKPGANPFFEREGKSFDWVVKVTGQKAGLNSYLKGPTTITIYELLEPTRAVLGGFFLVFLLSALLMKKSLGPFDSTEIWMFVFSVLLIASALLQSRRTAFGLRTASDAFIVPFLAYYIARRIVTSENRFRMLLQVLGYTGFYLIVIGLIERLLHSSLTYRLSGPFQHRDPYYVVLMVCFFMVLLDTAQSIEHPNRKQILPFFVRRVVIFMVPVMIFLTWTRGNWLGFVLGACVFLFLGYRLLTPRRKLGVIGLLLLLALVIATSMLNFFPKKIVNNRITNLHNIYARLGAWQAGVKVVFKHPIFGIGLNNTRDVLEARGTTLKGVRSLTTLHNCFLAILIELGFVGILAYLAIVASIFKKALNLYRKGAHTQDQRRGACVLAIMVAYLIPALTETLLYVPSLCHIYVFTSIGGIAGVYSSQGRMHALQVNRMPQNRPLAPL